MIRSGEVETIARNMVGPLKVIRLRRCFAKNLTPLQIYRDNRSALSARRGERVCGRRRGRGSDQNYIGEDGKNVHLSFAY